MRADNLRVLTWTAVGLLGAAALLAGRWLLNPRDGTLSFHQGPVFTNVLLADEINRA